jgi:hypothetical protein
MRFSIRDMLLVTIIVALAVGWLVNQSRLARAQQMIRTRDSLLTNLGCIAEWKEDGVTLSRLDTTAIFP